MCRGQAVRSRRAKSGWFGSKLKELSGGKLIIIIFIIICHRWFCINRFVCSPNTIIYTARLLFGTTHPHHSFSAVVSRAFIIIISWSSVAVNGDGVHVSRE